MFVLDLSILILVRILSKGEKKIDELIYYSKIEDISYFIKITLSFLLNPVLTVFQFFLKGREWYDKNELIDVCMIPIPHSDDFVVYHKSTKFCLIHLLCSPFGSKQIA